MHFLSEAIQARIQWNKIFNVLTNKSCQVRLIYFQNEVK